MNRFAGLTILVVAFATGTLVAQQETDSTDVKTEQVSVAPEQSVASIVTDLPKDKDLSLAATKLPGDTHVRIVRLSQTQGKVGMDRGTGHGVEQSIQNMPIVEGMLLGTADDGSYAEVEFEDGSTLRLGPGTVVRFSQLVLRASGAKATTIRLDRGTVYVSRENTKADEFTLVPAGMRKIDIAPSTHLRVELTGAKAAVAVWSGNATVEGSGAPVVVGKKQTLTLDVTDSNSLGELAKNVTEGPFDGWDQDAQKYHERYAKANSLVAGGYGASDLNYYGSFMNIAGYGMIWQPYFVGAGWSPYANGLWASYPGGIYSWVSPYPWGWLPFHSGAWTYIPSYGWGWQPGSTFVGLNNVAGGQLPINGGPAHIPGGTLPRPPAESRASFVQVNQQPLVFSKADAGGKFVFRNDSAGLGVPRGAMGKLDGISNEVAHHGSANRDVYLAPAGSSSHWNDGQVYHGPLAYHSGSMSDEARQAMWARQQNAASAAQTQHGDANPARAASVQNGSATGWQGHQGQPGQPNSANNNLGWKQGGSNAAASGANSQHNWNNAGAGAGAGTSGHSWNNANAGGASGGGHTWNGGGGNASAGGGGGGHWSGGSGGGAPAANAGGSGNGGSSSGSGANSAGGGKK